VARGVDKRKKTPRRPRAKDPVRVQAALKGWDTRRRKALAREREARRLAKIRQQAAIKGWETRRKNKRARSRRAKKGWRTRWFRQARYAAADGLHGKLRADWKVLVAMIDNNDPAWLAFLARAEELGFTTRAARDEWFSPQML